MQDPNQVLDALRTHTESHAPPQTRLTFRKLAFHAQPYLMPRDTVANRAATKVQLPPCNHLSVALDCMCCVHTLGWTLIAGACASTDVQTP